MYIIYVLPDEFRGAKRAKIARTKYKAAILCRVHARRERTSKITWHLSTAPRNIPISGLLPESLAMKVKRVKHARKYLTLFKNSFGIFEPYQVLG